MPAIAFEYGRGAGRTITSGSTSGPIAGFSTREADRVDKASERLASLRSRDSELEADIQRLIAEREAVQAQMVLAEVELDAAVNAPVSGGRDPTDWLPDELMLAILLKLPFDALFSGACERVCRRWAHLMNSAPIKRRMRDGKWEAYEQGVILPEKLEGRSSTVYALAIGLDGKVYSGSWDTTIRVWNPSGRGHPQTLRGHTGGVYALAVGLDGQVFSGSTDRTVRVWCGEDGTHLRTLEGHSGPVNTLAVGLDGTLYSGSADGCIRVSWS